MKNPTNTAARHVRDGHLPRPIARALAPFESVWLGVTLLAVLLVYMSVGSALPMVRESRFFEMTEFEWFNWWPFAVLSALVCVNLTVVTIRRIPFNTVKLGVWLIHTGIVALILSSWYYFASKIEGDTPVIRRLVAVTTPSGERVQLPALPGAEARAGEYSFRVANLDPTWPILSGEHEGEEAFSVSVMVTPPLTVNGGAPFIRQLLAGYPQYTEDVLPGRGRAVKATGDRFVDQQLRVTLELAPQRWYHLAQTRALFVRQAGSPDWIELPMSGLPRYNDWVNDPGRDLWLAPGDAIPPAQGLDVTVAGAADAIGIDARATGFVRYAGLQERLIRGGATDPPGVILQITGPEGRGRVIQLAPGIDGYSSTPDSLATAVALRSPQDAADLLDRARPTFRVEVNGTVIESKVERTLGDDPALGFTPVGDTGFAYRVRIVADGLQMPGGEELSAAVLEVRTPEGDQFIRIVSDGTGAVQDIDTDANGGAIRDTIDDRLRADYTAGNPPATLTVALGPDFARDAAVLLSSTGTAPDLIPAPMGEPVPLPGGGSLRVLELLSSAKIDARPAIVPKRQRDRAAGEYFSMLRVQIGTQEQWLKFHEYVFDGPTYRYQGRFIYEPTLFTLPDGRTIEAIYSRERRPLPAPVALEDFHLRAHVGGFTGATPSIRDWISEVRFAADTGWSDPVEVRTNHPATHGDLSFFQARWDPPPAATGPGAGLSGGGFAFTGLGVGSRDGVGLMLASSSVSILGMIYTFYVKPSIQRSRVRRALIANAARTQASENELKPGAANDRADLEPAEVGA